MKYWPGVYKGCWVGVKSFRCVMIVADTNLAGHIRGYTVTNTVIHVQNDSYGQQTSHPVILVGTYVFYANKGPCCTQIDSEVIHFVDTLYRPNRCPHRDGKPTNKRP